MKNTKKTKMMSFSALVAESLLQVNSLNMKDSILTKLRPTAVTGLSALVLLTSWTLGWAQDSSNGTYEKYATLSTEVPGVSTFVEPPGGFNGLAATDEEIAMYGFPPRPDKSLDPRGFESWSKMITAAKFRWKGPLKMTGHQIGTPSQANGVRANVADSQITDSNLFWSGFGNYKNISAYSQKQSTSSSISSVTAQFNVPIVEDPSGVSGCESYANGSVNLMVGIDAPTLEGGVFADNPGWLSFSGDCFVQAPVYYAQIGAGTSTSILQEFNVNPGDTIFVYVWDSSATTGYAYIADLTTFTYATYAITTTPILGDSAQFLMARVYTNGSLMPLPNYTEDFWAFANARDFNGKTYGPGTNSTTVTTYLYEMTDDAGDQVVSFPEPFTQSFYRSGYATYGILFSAEGCARSYGCIP